MRLGGASGPTQWAGERPEIGSVFFSSRRRHTRFDCDWSSDVCSSDLPRFSPDGQRVIMSLQQGGNANIFVMDLRSKTTTRLTDTAAIDTAPSYSPDGARICFESDRGGSQQIYIMGAGGGQAQRVSFGEGSYSNPVWSLPGHYITFTKHGSGTFA